MISVLVVFIKHNYVLGIGITTGFRRFAECLRPKYTRQRLCQVPHSAKATREKNGWQSSLCRVPFVGHSAKLLPCAETALGKENEPSRRRKRWRWLCRVPTRTALGKVFHFFLNSLPSAARASTRQSFLFLFFLKFFAERRTGGSRQSFLFLFLKKSLLSAGWVALGKVFYFF